MKKQLPLLTISLILLSCAVIQKPPGGPEDKTPPGMLVLSPKKNSTQVSPHTSFKITFSESMNKDATEKAIFLSPVFWDYPTLKWSGNTLTITPPETLKSNTTYILTIGAGASDINGNKIGKSQSLAFSTGAIIDSGAISGAVFTDEPSRTTYDVWAYRLANLDSLEFWKNIPDYVTQIDSNGGFAVDHLGLGHYFIVAIDDRNDDLFWDPSSDAIALPPAIVELQAEEEIHGINLRPNRRDTSMAYITKVIAVSNQKISIEFSQPVPKKAMINSDSYSVRAVDTDSILATGLAYFSEAGVLVLGTDTQIPERLYRVIPVNLKTVWGVPFDTAGARFTGTAVLDTIGPKLLSIYPANNSSNIYQDSVIELTFSERLQVRGFAENITVIADSLDTLKYMPIWIQPNQARLRFPSRIPRGRNIAVKLIPSNIYDLHKNPMPDSSLSFQFRIPLADTVGDVIASANPIDGKKLFGKLKSYQRDGDSYQAGFDNSGKLHFDAVMPGNYRFEYFIDSDSNGEWSAGIVAPFKPAEWFSVLPETLIVRSRWTTDVGEITLPESRH